MMIDDEWLLLLRCPVTRQPLRAATREEKLARGIPGEEDALCTVDGSRFYRAPEGMPQLVPTANDEVAGG
jgi:uncharacterized protein YbaR (Trm112 family)